MRTLLSLLPAILFHLILVHPSFGDEPAKREWTVDGVAREAVVYIPAGAKKHPTPVVFVFHGHGGKAEMMVRRFAMHKLWPEAIVVCPQGLPTPGRLTDPEGKRAGWQSTAGAMNDRDLHFFDAMLKDLRKENKVDDKRIYSTGHSNGGGFTYLLWATRGDDLAAVAPCAATGSADMRKNLKPKPALHLAGENDPLVRYAWQQASIKMIRELNQCEEGREWEKHCTLYPSKVGAPLVTFIHPGGHEIPTGAPEAIARFFKEHLNLVKEKP